MSEHDPKAQAVITQTLLVRCSALLSRTAAAILDDLADAGLVVVSDAAEPADAEQRAAAFEAAQAPADVHTVTADEFLAEAATLLRERAEAVPPGPWVHDFMGTVADCDDDPVCSATFDPAVAAFIERMDPGVALAFADWLDGVAGEWSGTRDVDDRALAVAVAILGRRWVP